MDFPKIAQGSRKRLSVCATRRAPRNHTQLYVLLLLRPARDELARYILRKIAAAKLVIGRERIRFARHAFCFGTRLVLS